MRRGVMLFSVILMRVIALVPLVLLQTIASLSHRHTAITDNSNHSRHTALSGVPRILSSMLMAGRPPFLQREGITRGRCPALLDTRVAGAQTDALTQVRQTILTITWSAPLVQERCGTILPFKFATLRP